MSRIGKVPISIPKEVEVAQEGNTVTVKGPLGSIDVDIVPGVVVGITDDQVKISVKSNDLVNGKAYWGLIRSLLNNAVAGVKDGFFKELELVGIGYRVEKVGNDLKLSVGYSHPVEVKAPEGITFELEGNTVIKVVGINKQLVGQVAANIRSIRKPEPYKGKGIRYKGEVVKRKPGKVAKAIGV